MIPKKYKSTLHTTKQCYFNCWNRTAAWNIIISGKIIPAIYPEIYDTDPSLVLCRNISIFQHAIGRSYFYDKREV